MRTSSTADISSRVSHRVGRRHGGSTFFFGTGPAFTLSRIAIRGHGANHGILSSISLTFRTNTARTILISTRSIRRRRTLITAVINVVQAADNGIVRGDAGLTSTAPISILKRHVNFVPRQFTIHNSLSTRNGILCTVSTSGHGFLRPGPIVTHRLLGHIKFRRIASNLPINGVDTLSRHHITVTHTLDYRTRIVVTSRPATKLGHSSTTIILKLLGGTGHSRSHGHTVVIIASGPRITSRVRRYTRLR